MHAYPTLYVTQIYRHTSIQAYMYMYMYVYRQSHDVLQLHRTGHVYTPDSIG